MVRPPGDHEPRRAWTRFETIAYWVSVGAILFGTIALDVAIEVDNRPLAIGILLVGISIVFALISYAVWYVRRMP